MNNIKDELYQIGKKSKSDKIWHHGYHRFYSLFLNNIRNDKINMLEIGLDRTNSLTLWREYFPKAHIYGIDIDTTFFGDKQVTIFKGDQSDVKFLKQVVNNINKKIEFIIDDGSHVPEHQIISFNYLFKNLLQDDGIYIIEDIETSYWKKGKLYGYDVGYEINNISLPEIFKSVIDKINIEFIPTNKKNKYNTVKHLDDDVLNMIESVYFGTNCIIILKKNMDYSKRYDKRTYRFEQFLRQPTLKQSTIPKKIAFMFLTKLDLNKHNIWKAYLKNHENKYNIYVHPYEYYNSTKIKVTNSLLKNNIIKNIVKTDYTHVYRAILELYKVAIKDTNNYKFILLSESDIPITSFDIMYSFLTKNNNSYVKSQGQINDNEYKNRIKVILDKTTIIPKNKYIRHQAWHCLNREHVLTILNADSKYHDIFSKMEIANEHYLTILWLYNKHQTIQNRSIIYNNWNYTQLKYKQTQKVLDKLYNLYDQDNTNHKLKQKIDKLKHKLRTDASHPKMYSNKMTKSDILEIAQSKSLFARKFDTSSNMDKYWKKIIKYNDKWFI